MDTVNGLPVHPLLVHFIVVAIPVAAVAAVVAAVWPRARARMGIWPALLALVSLVVTPIVTTAGEALEEIVGSTEAVETHTAAGDVVIIGVGCLFGATAAMYLIGLRAVTDRLGPSSSIVCALDVLTRVLTVVAAVVAVYLVIRAGDTGTHAVWDGIVG